MARAKFYCRGKNKDGSSCMNYALRDSFYCQLHQSQFNAKDKHDMQSINTWSTIILLLIVVVGFLISLAVGCEDHFFKWMTK